MELKNRQQRMEYVQDTKNWKLLHSTEFVKQYVLEYGEHEFLRIEGFLLDRFYREPKYSWIAQFEIMFDGNNDYLENRSNTEIVNIMGRKEK